MLILWLLKGRLGWPLTLSKLVAAETAMANNFLWNDLWTSAIWPSGKATEWPAAPLRQVQRHLRGGARPERRAARHAGRPLRDQIPNAPTR